MIENWEPKYDLGKWPRLLVMGEPVTEDQAAEIIIRTNSWHYLMSNDKEWEAIVRKETGLPDMFGELESFKERWDKHEQFRESIKAVSLEYLYNDQITSSWIGGPHGWMSWSGHVGCSTHNIGKWPNYETILEEWTAIAEAFPYLNLKSQLITDEGEGKIAVEYYVAGGKVSVHEPAGQLAIVKEAPFNLGARHRERGCSVEQLRHGLELAKKAE